MFKAVEDGPKYTPEANKLIRKVTSGRSKGPWKSKQSKIESRLLKLQENTLLENKEVGRSCKYFVLQSAVFIFHCHLL